MLVKDCKMKVNLFSLYSKSGWGFAHAEQVSCLLALSDDAAPHGGYLAKPGAPQGAGAWAEPQHTDPCDRLSAHGGLAGGQGISPARGNAQHRCGSARHEENQHKVVQE